MAKEHVTRTGFSTATVLGIVFLTLKLSHVIDWSWLWVLAPFWIPVVLVMVISLAVLLFLGVLAVAALLIEG